jgi:hypothetical protein
MPDDTTTITPVFVGDFERVELGDGNGKGKRTLWRKEILPAGKRKYKDTVLDFGTINPSCVRAFQAGAFDHVPFVLADPDNSHPGDDPNRLEGDLHNLELSPDGRLIGYFALGPQAESLVEKSSRKLGVSARIDVDYTRPDTEDKYEYALAHVCGTLRPHIRGMNPWEKVILSEEVAGRRVLDFSTEVETEDSELVTLQLTKRQLDTLLKFLEDFRDDEAFAQSLLDAENEAATTLTDINTSGGFDMASLFLADGDNGNDVSGYNPNPGFFDGFEIPRGVLHGSTDPAGHDFMPFQEDYQELGNGEYEREEAKLAKDPAFQSAMRQLYPEWQGNWR